MLKGGPHECSDFNMKNKNIKGQLGFMEKEKQVNKTSDITGNLIYDGREDEGYKLKKRNVRI